MGYTNLAALATQPAITAPLGDMAEVDANGPSYWAWYPNTSPPPPAGTPTTPGNGGVWAYQSPGLITGWMNIRSPLFAGGAKLDGQVKADGHMLLASHTLTSASNSFVAADVGKSIRVAGAGAGGADLVTTISAFGGAGSVTLLAAAGTAVAGVQFVWGTDDGPAWQAAVTALAGTGIAAFADRGICVIATPVVYAPFFTMVGTSSVTIAQMLTGGTNFSAFSGNPTLGVQTTVTAINVVGTKILQSATNYAAGTWIYVNDVALLRGNLYQVQSSAAAGGHFNLTLDRPVQWQFAINDVIWPVTTMMQEVRIYGNGMKFTGTSQGTVTGYIGFGGAYRCFMFDCNADGSLGSLGPAAAVFNFDIGSLECAGERVKVNGSGVVSIGAALQSCERSYFKGSTLTNCAVGGSVMYDCVDCGVEADTSGNAFATQFLSNEAGSTVGCTRCWYRGNSSGDAVGPHLSYCSSYNKIEGNFSYATSMGVSVTNVNGPCLGNELNGAINGCEEATGAGGALNIVGNGHTLKSKSLTCSQAQGRSIFISGNGCRVEFDELISYDPGLTGNWFLVQVAGTSDAIIKGGYCANTQTIAGIWAVFQASSSGTIEVDDYVVEKLGGASVSVVFLAQTVAVYRARNVRTKGSLTLGVDANGGVAVTFRVLEGCDFSSCTVPFQFDATSQPNRVTVQAVSSAVPIATVFADLTQIAPYGEQVKITRSAAGGTVGPGLPLIIPTPTVGWTTTFAATDASTYLEEAA